MFSFNFRNCAIVRWGSGDWLGWWQRWGKGWVGVGWGRLNLYQKIEERKGNKGKR